MHIILAQLIIELTHALAPAPNPQGGLDDNNAHPAQVSWYITCTRYRSAYFL